MVFLTGERFLFWVNDAVFLGEPRFLLPTFGGERDDLLFFTFFGERDRFAGIFVLIDDECRLCRFLIFFWTRTKYGEGGVPRGRD